MHLFVPTTNESRISSTRNAPDCLYPSFRINTANVRPGRTKRRCTTLHLTSVKAVCNFHSHFDETPGVNDILLVPNHFRVPPRERSPASSRACIRFAMLLQMILRAIPDIPPTTSQDRRSAGLRHAVCGAVSAGSAGPEAGAPGTVSRCALILRAPPLPVAPRRICCYLVRPT